MVSKVIQSLSNQISYSQVLGTIHMLAHLILNVVKIILYGTGGAGVHCGIVLF